MTLAYPDVLVRLDDSVIEVFRRLVTGSRRTPLAWAGVQLKPKQGDQIHVSVGTSQEPTDPFYNDHVLGDSAYSFDVAAGEQPRLREFFDEAARRGGRPAAASG